MKYKTAVFDLDGILLRNGVLERESRKAISILKENGVRIIYSSGKNYWYTAGGVSFCGMMEKSTIIMAENGGLAYYPEKRELHTLGKNIRDVGILAEEYISCCCTDNGSSLVHNDSTSLLWREPKDTIFTLFPKDLGAIGAISEEIRSIIEKKDLSLYVVEHSDAVDTVPLGQNKGTALVHLHKKGEIDLDTTIAFGDGANDAEMLSAVAMPVTVSNAKDHIKEIVKRRNGIIAEKSVGKGVLEAVTELVARP